MSSLAVGRASEGSSVLPDSPLTDWNRNPEGASKRRRSWHTAELFFLFFGIYPRHCFVKVLLWTRLDRLLAIGWALQRVLSLSNKAFMATEFSAPMISALNDISESCDQIISMMEGFDRTTQPQMSSAIPP